MIDPTVAAHRWYTRPVLFVTSLPAAIRFYVERLGFTTKWHVDNVCQVDRGDCEIILCEDRERRDRGRLFIELTRAGMDNLRDQLAGSTVPHDRIWWGYDTIRVVDPSGNELFFPLDETNDGERAPAQGA